MSPDRILIAEDDDALRGTLSEILELEGYSVEATANGVEALEATVQEPPSLVLLDMRMPTLDGWGYAREIHARGLEVPIVVMTASESASNVAAEIDAEDWVGKPVNLEDLLRAVRKTLARHHAA
jgi:two-component system response regulator MprA